MSPMKKEYRDKFKVTMMQCYHCKDEQYSSCTPPKCKHS